MKSVFIIVTVAITSLAACSTEEQPCPTTDLMGIQKREDSLNSWEQSLVLRERALANQMNSVEAQEVPAGSRAQDVQTASQSSVGAYKANVSTGKSGVPYKRSSQANPGQYPEGSERLLTEKDVQYQTAWGKKVMLNEIYARKGMIFSDEALKKHFSRESWYKGRKSKVSPKNLSNIERQNIAFIESHQ